ncbi:hypothetical protein M3M33_13535, partial [Loigolactobacillus coryniformis]|uniref:hypothetical protein n=1 Tax=Loigolactobacillus coryniformis TaxID=1610 RepID=UPI00201AB410
LTSAYEIAMKDGDFLIEEDLELDALLIIASSPGECVQHPEVGCQLARFIKHPNPTLAELEFENLVTEQFVNSGIKVESLSIENGVANFELKI